MTSRSPSSTYHISHLSAPLRFYQRQLCDQFRHSAMTRGAIHKNRERLISYLPSGQVESTDSALDEGGRFIR
jgi:hypothetical protein